MDPIYHQPLLSVLSEEATDVSFLDDKLLISQTWMVSPVSSIALDGSFRYCDLIGHGIVNRMRERIDFVPIFTDEDLANRYIRLVSKSGLPLRAVPCVNIEQIVTLYKTLDNLGVQRIAIDPGETTVNVYPISSLLRGAQQAQERQQNSLRQGSEREGNLSQSV
jgi:hypothetical protein